MSDEGSEEEVRSVDVNVREALSEGLRDVDEAIRQLTARKERLERELDPLKPRILDYGDKQFIELDDDLEKEIIRAPICGGIFIDQSQPDAEKKLIPWSGTDPDSDYLCYSWDPEEKKWVLPRSLYHEGCPKRKGAVHLEMYRPTGPKEAKKAKETCTEYVGTKFNGIPTKGNAPNMSIRIYKDTIRTHMIKTGMWDIFNIPSPNASLGTQYVDLIQHHAMFTMDYVKDYVKNLVKDTTRCDNYVIQNLDWSSEYLRRSLTGEFLKLVLKFTSVNASGLEIFMAIMHECFSDSYDALVTVKDKLRRIKLRDYAGENVELCVVDILDLSDRLDCAGAFDDDLLCNIIGIFEKATDKKLSLYAMNEYAKCKEYIQHKRLGTTPPVKFDYKSICNKTLDKYRELKESDRWELSGIDKDSSQEMQLPKAYEAAMQALNATIEQLKKRLPAGTGNSNNTGTGTGSGRGPKCYNCHQFGHIAKDCPVKSDTEKDNTPSTESGETPWYLVPPKDGKADTIKKHKGRTHYWCTSCKSYRRHKTSEHAAWKSKQDKNKNRNTNTNAQAHVAEITEGASEGDTSTEAASDDGPTWMFGGLSSQTI